MGLDMYLNRRTYIQNWDHMPAKEKHKITKKQLPANKQYIKTENISEITEQVGYWRKANSIHNYFVNTCQDGEDDCREAPVSTETLDDLLNACKNILKAKEEITDLEELNDIIQDSLPPTSGFFFGSTAIDDWYFKDLQHTVEIIEGLEKGVYKDSQGDEHSYYLGDIYYSSSW